MRCLTVPVLLLVLGVATVFPYRPGPGLIAAAEAGGTGQTGAAFFTGVEDLPLMPGLAEVPADTMVFDSPEGRFAEAYAVGRVGRTEVLDFYARTLPQLGWRGAGPVEYRREGEVLTIEFLAGDGDAPLTVRFAVSPASDTSP